MILRRVIKLTLKPTEEQKQMLLDTIEQYKYAYNYIAKIGWEAQTWNGLILHHLTYYPLRKQIELPAHLVCSAMIVASENLKVSIRNKRKGKKSSCPQSNNPAIRYKKGHGYSIWIDRKEISLATVKGRQKFSIKVPDYFKQYLDWDMKSATLKYDKKAQKFFFYIHIEKSVNHNEEVAFYVGVDLGLSKLAVVSTPDGKINKIYDGGQVKAISERYLSLRKRLQSKGTPSARRHLKKISQKEQRFRTDINHKIAKDIVSLVPTGGVIVLEKLKGIRDRVKGDKKMKRWLHSWSFAQLQQFIEYKAQAKGIKVVYVDARYTSQKCSKCGHIARSNRIDQSHFKCQKCGYTLNADLNASRNIVKNYLTSLKGKLGLEAV